jgi:RHH-type rel operon transcriptional repressor/antitoxin RelB
MGPPVLETMKTPKGSGVSSSFFHPGRALQACVTECFIRKTYLIPHARQNYVYDVSYVYCRPRRTQEDNLLSIRLKPDIERRLSRLAKETGRTKTFYASKLIEENLEDLEDRYLAEARLEKRGKTYTSAQVRSELGLDD